jgi:hypothetical protein
MRLELRGESNGWINVKAVLPAGSRKRSFWLSWNGTEQRFAAGHCYKIAAEHYPMVLDAVLQRIAAWDFDMVPGPMKPASPARPRISEDRPC